MSDTLGTKEASRPLEELVQIQALSVDLREAVMACLCGRESRRWTIAEVGQSLVRFSRERAAERREALLEKGRPVPKTHTRPRPLGSLQV